ncbi:pupal cuticle protein 36-like [Photinus pyralis]|uniref:pupal cuticle protein 36-like n=1 Tax=Photinus pyralis TaxID=7054 RepID=UPI001267043B|nr:pupal cuticle protein 36-like [Photinus pyralis]
MIICRIIRYIKFIMKYQLILLGVVSVVLARPDVSHLGYSYSAPSGSYLPGEHAASSSSHGGRIIPAQVVYEPSQPSGSYLPGVSGGAGGDGYFGSGSSHHGSGHYGGSIGGFGGHGHQGGFGGQGGFVGGQGGLIGGQGGFLGGQGGFIGGQGGFGGHDLLSEDTEVHYYGDDAQQQSRLRIHVAPAPSRNRVLFVKSPDVGSSIIPEIIAPSTPSQERTVVYVLSKKQDAVGTINLPASVTNNVVKSKPEVFYLRYKDSQDAERVVADSLSGKTSGSGVRPINDKDSFVKTLATGQHGGINGILGSFGSGSSHGSSGISLGGHGISGGHGIGGGHTVISTGGGVGGLDAAGSSSSGSGSKYGTPGASGPY